MQNKSLQELLDFLKEWFPKIQEKMLIKILFTLKARSEQFNSIWFSRKEAYKFNMSEWTLQKIIYYLRNYWIIELVWQTKTKNFYDYQKCNVYKLSDNFKQLFKDLQFFTKKVFEYINPLEFMKKFFSYKFKYHKYEFKVNWLKYIIHTTWRFKNKIFWVEDNKIINPYTLLQT